VYTAFERFRAQAIQCFDCAMDDAAKILAAWADEEGAPLVITRAGTVVADTEAHCHGRGQLIACAKGVLSVGTETGHWVVPSRHGIWVPPHHVHCAQPLGAFTGWSLYVARNACNRLPSRPCTLAINPLLWEAALRSASWDLAPLNLNQARLAMVIVDELAALPSRPLGLALPQDARLKRVARALLKDVADRRDLRQWAALAGLSTRTLSRRWLAETSLSFTAWQQHARLLVAMERLACGASVTSAAFDAGYSSVSAFIALFKRTFGVTPSAYANVTLTPS
jgi:AraC-like DNA-binding protein